jgi:Kef-type K+ transport system membrane component KefB
MVYTKRQPAILIIGIALLALGYCTDAGILDGVLKYLGTARVKSEMISLPYTFGAIAAVIGLWQLIGFHRQGGIDYYSSAIGGAIFILLIAMLIRWFLDPLVAVWSKAIGPVFGGKYIHDVAGLNYVVLGIVAGIVVVRARPQVEGEFRTTRRWFVMGDGDAPSRSASRAAIVRWRLADRVGRRS